MVSCSFHKKETWNFQLKKIKWEQLNITPSTFSSTTTVTEKRRGQKKRRDDTLAHLKRLFENKAKLSCIAKDESHKTTCLMLRGYVNLNSPCLQACAKRLLGRHSCCKPSYFGDMVSLCRFVHIDRNLTVTGRLPCLGNNSIKKLKPFATDPKFVVKILLDSIDKKDFEQYKEQHKDNGIDVKEG